MDAFGENCVTYLHNSGTWYPSCKRNLATGTAIVISQFLPLRSNALRSSSTKYRNTSLSLNLPPLSAAPGYSQSRSNPSKLYLSIKSTTLLMNVCRRDLTATIFEYFEPPSAHPPTATCNFNCGWVFFKSVKFRNPLLSMSSWNIWWRIVLTGGQD